MSTLHLECFVLVTVFEEHSLVTGLLSQFGRVVEISFGSDQIEIPYLVRMVQVGHKKQKSSLRISI